MRLDHVSYVASHEQISDTVQRIGSQIGTAFVDGGIHPRFGTRNFTAPLLNGQYIEVVCALDHPAAEQTAFGQAVSKKAAEGGGWLTWVFSTDDLAPIEAAIGRPAIDGHRRRPDGTDLKWRQVGVRELLTDPELPFFIQWEDGHHPSEVGIPAATISRIIFSNSHPLYRSIFKGELTNSLRISGIELVTLSEPQEFESGIMSIEFQTAIGIVSIN
jgi:Glyoxalase-like domain